MADAALAVLRMETRMDEPAVIQAEAPAPTRDGMLLIGVSPRILRDVPSQLGFKNKTLQYLEQSVAHWVSGMGALVVMVPTVERRSMMSARELKVDDYAHALDGLVLQGGADIHPSAYGETPHAQLGPTDSVRDRFELDLVRAFVGAGKPVLGICRGMQLLNVACGGTLYQDVNACGITPHEHVRAGVHEDHAHELEIDPESRLAAIYPERERAQVNSIHHQSVKDLGAGLVIEAKAPDGVVEAIRLADADFVVGVQWHPEYQDERFPELLPRDPLMESFLVAAGRRRILR
jgi:putative glutamine amidotransferase